MGSWLARALAILSAIALFLLAAVSVDQAQVPLRFLAWQTPPFSLFWWLLAAFLAGLALGLGLAAAGRARQALRNRRLRKELEAANLELRQLRGAPPDAD